MNRYQADDRRVVIVGAGVAGLAAAYHLRQNGFQNIMILEAQSQIGGRLRTNRSLGLAFDEGASWIHGPKGNPITEIAEKAGANTFMTEDDNIKVYDVDGSEYEQEVLEEAEEIYEDLLEEVQGSSDRSFGEVFFEQFPQYKNDRLWTFILSAFLEFDTGSDIYQLSSVDFYDDEDFRGKDVLITDGYDKVADYLAQGIEIQLNSRVTAVDYTGATAIVTTDQAEYEADFVLVTVSLGVLKKGILSFQPALPAPTQSAINNLEMGTVNKFLLTWDTAFWDTDVQYIGFTPEERGKFNFFLNLRAYTEANALMTFAFGDFAVRTEEMSDAAIVEQIMAHLQIMYGEDVPPPRQFLRTLWRQNEYTFGSYSFATNGTRSSDFDVFSEPINERLFFGGEHTIAAYRGTVHGAYLSGLRAARQIMSIAGNYSPFNP
ncbi:MAG: NAD(P)/FAD-dependent oxidoreductase [Bacteroidota bacterium]